MRDCKKIHVKGSGSVFLGSCGEGDRSLYACFCRCCVFRLDFLSHCGIAVRLTQVS